MGKSVYSNNMARACVIVTDFVILNVLLILFMNIEGDASVLNLRRKVSFVLANFSMIIAEFFFGTIIFQRLVSVPAIAANTFKLSLLQTVITILSLKALDIHIGNSASNLLIFFICFYPLLLLSRMAEFSILKRMRRLGHNVRRVILVGNDPALRDLYQTLISDLSFGYIVKGFFSDNPNTDMSPRPAYLGDLNKLNEAIRHTMMLENTGNPNEPVKLGKYNELANVDEIFCCLSHNLADTVTGIMDFCDRNLIHFFYVPRQFGIHQMRLQSINFNGMTIFTNHTSPLEKPVNRIIKRCFDILVSLAACICLLPLIPVIGLIIFISSPGPIFFRQERTGLDGKTFKCIKFRSMHVNKDADRVQATEHDPRKFAFGNFMRKTNIDELPQFFNVLIGDMSIVGPRPHMLYHTEYYSKLIDKYMVRHFCKPGITGLAQISGYRGETKELSDMEGRVLMDIKYIETWSFSQDIYIIFKTFLDIFKHDDKAY